MIIPSPQLGYLPGGEDKNEESPHIAHHLVLEAMEKKCRRQRTARRKGRVVSKV